jgi:uncharacterized protein YneF (UPF0154 family)
MGIPIYPPIDYKSFRTVVFLLIGYALAIAGFYIGYYLFIKCKKPRKMKKERPRINLSV